MKAFETIGEVDEQHRLQIVLPEDVPTGAVRVIVLMPEADEAETEADLVSYWLTASSPALQAVWDNEEDAVYDQL